METRLQILLIVSSVFFLIIVLNMVKKETLQLKYTLAWIFTGCVFVLISIKPRLVTLLANLLGIGLTVNALFLMGIIFSMIILMTVTIAVSRNSVKTQRLAQELALIKLEMMISSERESESRT